MATETHSRPDTRPARNYNSYALIMLLMVGAILADAAPISIQNFREYHQQLAVTSVTGAADELELLISELQRSMRLFADDQLTLFVEIAGDPENDDAWAHLEKAVSKHFPEYFGLTLTSTAGEVLRPDFDNAVNEICEQDIHAFIDEGYSHPGYIHPNPMGYHFDVMVPWGDTDRHRRVSSFSASPPILARTLQRIQPPGHALLLLRSDKIGLIEVTAGGTCSDLQRDFTLSSDELPAHSLFTRRRQQSLGPCRSA